MINRLPAVRNAIVATMSSVGFGLSPVSGLAIATLAVSGTSGFAALGAFGLSRFTHLEVVRIARQGW